MTTTYAVFAINDTTAYLCFLVSDPVRGQRALPGTWTWQPEGQTWLRLEDTTITHTIVPYVVDHAEEYDEDERSWRWRRI